MTSALTSVKMNGASALAVLDRPRPGLAPLLEDGNAAGPTAWRNAVGIGLHPPTDQHAPVVVGVHLGDGRERSMASASGMVDAQVRLLTMAVRVLLM